MRANLALGPWTQQDPGTVTTRRGQLWVQTMSCAQAAMESITEGCALRTVRPRPDERQPLASISDSTHATRWRYSPHSAAQGTAQSTANIAFPFVVRLEWRRERPGVCGRR